MCKNNEVSNVIGLDTFYIKELLNEIEYYDSLQVTLSKFNANLPNTFEYGNKTPIVDFGKYNYMWVFDDGYCLVSVHDDDPTTFANRGIIDSHGNEVVKPYTYTNIWKFYGEDRPEIVAFTEDGIVGLDRKKPLTVIKRHDTRDR